MKTPDKGGGTHVRGLGLTVFFSLLISLTLYFGIFNHSLWVPGQEASSQDLRKKALETLQAGTESPHPFVRSAAAKAAGDSRDPAVLPLLLRSIKDDDPMVRTFAVESAAGFSHSDAGILLRQGLKDSSLSVRLTTARVLNRYSGPERAPILKLASNDSHALVRLMALGRTPAGIPGNHMDSFRDILEKGTSQEKIIAATALGNTQSPDAVLLLGRLMTSQDPSLRSFSARALGQVSSLEAFPFLKEGVRDESPEVRSESLQAITHLEALDPTSFLKQASNDPDPWVRLSAGLGFLRAGDEGYRNLLDEALSSPDFGLRSAAARALGEMARDDRVPIPENLFKTLIDGVRDPSERVRSASTRTLGMIGKPQALDRLELTLRDPDPSVRCYAAGAILAILLHGL